MIERTVLHSVRNGVCAVGCLTEPLSDWIRDYQLSGMFRIVGTGFLVRPDIVLTNRHVLDALEKEQQALGVPDTQLFLIFVVPLRDHTDIRITARWIRRYYPLRDRHVDVGLIKFEIVHSEHFEDVVPVTTGDPRTVQVSEEIAAFGYPHGNALLEKDGRVGRWGPVVQQGWVSGIEPYEGLGDPTEFLLDVRSAEGISGAPVFQPSIGKVVGVLHSGTDDRVVTTSFAQPVSEVLLADWISEFERNTETETTRETKSFVRLVRARNPHTS